jgi:RNA polymerase-binding protein DksA
MGATHSCACYRLACQLPDAGVKSEMLDQDQIASFAVEEGAMGVSHEVLRRRLEDQRARLLEEMKQFRIAGRGNLGYGNHQADDATDAFEQAKELSLLQNSERVLAQVEDALVRFEQGIYGICERCGEQIDPARLKALPYASLCMDCQQHVERG